MTATSKFEHQISLVFLLVDFLKIDLTETYRLVLSKQGKPTKHMVVSDQYTQGHSLANCTHMGYTFNCFVYNLKSDANIVGPSVLIIIDIIDGV